MGESRQLEDYRVDLPEPLWAHQGDELALLDAESHAAQHLHGRITRAMWPYRCPRAGISGAEPVHAGFSTRSVTTCIPSCSASPLTPVLVPFAGAVVRTGSCTGTPSLEDPEHRGASLRAAPLAEPPSRAARAASGCRQRPASAAPGLPPAVRKRSAAFGNRAARARVAAWWIRPRAARQHHAMHADDLGRADRACRRSADLAGGQQQQ